MKVVKNNIECLERNIFSKLNASWQSYYFESSIEMEWIEYFNYIYKLTETVILSE